MNKTTHLFHASSLTVLPVTTVQEGYVPGAKAVVTIGCYSVALDAAAVEGLVGYLRVIRAYSSYAGRPKGQVALLFGKVVEQLHFILHDSGKSLAEASDISLLIEQMGCMHDWVQMASA